MMMDAALGGLCSTCKINKFESASCACATTSLRTQNRCVERRFRNNPCKRSQRKAGRTFSAVWQHPTTLHGKARGIHRSTSIFQIKRLFLARRISFIFKTCGCIVGVASLTNQACKQQQTCTDRPCVVYTNGEEPARQLRGEEGRGGEDVMVKDCCCYNT